MNWKKTLDSIASAMDSTCKAAYRRRLRRLFRDVSEHFECQKKGWLNANEQPPEPNRSVLFIVQFPIYLECREFVGEYRGSYKVNNEMVHEFSTHSFRCWGTWWMPMPELPTFIKLRFI